MTPQTARPNLHTPNWRALNDVLVHLLECKDPETRGHSQRVQRNVMLLARRLKQYFPDTWDPYVASCAKIASYLHDIGKVMVDKTTLRNRIALNPEQQVELRSHPAEGARMLATLYPREVTEAILHHHERWDGNTADPMYPGYPDGLAGEDIPPIARAIKIADVYDAMTTERSYSQAVTRETALRHLLAEGGRQFDPAYTRLFVTEVSHYL